MEWSLSITCIATATGRLCNERALQEDRQAKYTIFEKALQEYSLQPSSHQLSEQHDLARGEWIQSKTEFDKKCTRTSTPPPRGRIAGLDYEVVELTSLDPHQLSGIRAVQEGQRTVALIAQADSMDDEDCRSFLRFTVSVHRTRGPWLAMK